MDSLHLALKRRGVPGSMLRDAIEGVLRGPPGHVNRSDIISQFPELSQARETTQYSVQPTQEALSESGADELAGETPFAAPTDLNPPTALLPDIPMGGLVAEGEAMNAPTQDMEQQHHSPISSPAIVSDDESEQDGESVTTGSYQYRRVARWIYNENAEMEAELEWANSVVPVRNLCPSDRAQAERMQQREQARRASMRSAEQRRQRDQRALRRDLARS